MPYDYVSQEYWDNLRQEFEKKQMWKWFMWAGVPTYGWYYIKTLTNEEYEEKMKSITKYLYRSDEDKIEGIDKGPGSAHKKQMHRFERV